MCASIILAHIFILDVVYANTVLQKSLHMEQSLSI